MFHSIKISRDKIFAALSIKLILKHPVLSGNKNYET